MEIVFLVFVRTFELFAKCDFDSANLFSNYSKLIESTV